MQYVAVLVPIAKAYSLVLVQTILQVMAFYCNCMWMNVRCKAVILNLFHRLVPKRSCGIIPAITEVQQFSPTTTWRSGSSFRDLMRAEKLLDTTHTLMMMMMMMTTPQPSLISGACLPVYGSWAAQPHHRRLYYIHTPCQG